MIYHKHLGVSKPSYKQVFDHNYLVSTVPPPAEMWLSPNIPPPEKNMLRALGAAEKAEVDYIDVHCSVFTPESFAKIMDELFRANIIKIQLHALRSTQYGQMDFAAMMRKVSQ